MVKLLKRAANIGLASISSNLWNCFLYQLGSSHPEPMLSKFLRKAAQNKTKNPNPYLKVETSRSPEYFNAIIFGRR